MKRILLITSAFILGITASAQQTFSMKEAINYSLQNHRSNLVFNNQVEKVRLQSKEALSAYLPQVNGSLSFDDNLKRQTTVLPGAIFGSTKDVQVQFGNKYNTNALVQLDQTIYDQALLYGIKAGVPSKKIAELNLAKNNEDLMYNTAVAYAQILMVKEQQKSLAANAKQYEDLNNITKFRFEKGIAKKVDLDRVLVQWNNIRAQQKQLQTNLEVAYNYLKNAMGLALTDAIRVDDSLDYRKYLVLEKDNVNVGDLIDFQLQAQEIALQEIDLKRRKAANLPTVSAYSRYGGQAFGNDLGKATSNWKDYSAIGLKVNVPIFSGRRMEAQVQQSRLELENARQNLELGSSRLQMQFQNAARQLQDNVTILSTNKNNMDLAKSVMEVSQFEYSKGVSTMSDLLNADFSYREAQSNYINSLLNLVANRLNYERARGTLSSFINNL